MHGDNSDETPINYLSEYNDNKTLDESSLTFGIDSEYFYDRKARLNYLDGRHRYEIYFYHKWILIKRPNVTNGVNLWINRETCECKEGYGSPVPPGEYPIIREYAYAILGIIRISIYKYLVIVTHETFITTINLPGKNKMSVYMIASAVCMSISPMGVGAVDEYITASPGVIKKSIGSAASWFSQHFKLGFDRDSPNTDDYRSDIKRQILLVERLLENGFYYSIDGDLGVKFQDLYTSKSSDSNIPRDDLFDFMNDNKKCNCVWSNRGNDSFKWNLNMGKYFPCCWLTSVIQGYYSSQTTLTPEGELTMILIGRRSIHKPGTRITCRGIDDTGHVANFVETELAVIMPNGYLSSLVMCRGSVPVFWEQSSVLSHPSIIHCFEMLKRPFMAHFTELSNQYGDILCVNLLNDKSEYCLTECFSNALRSVDRGRTEDLLQIGDGGENTTKEPELPQDVNCMTCHPFTGELSDCTISLINYDFSSNVNILSDALDLVEYISTKLVKFMDVHQHLLVDEHGKILNRQRGCIRVNCLDCLDRTGAFQWCYGWIWMIKTFESNSITGFTNIDITVNDARNALKSLKLPEIYKIFWSEYGDAVSLFYAGTASIYSSYISQGSGNLSVAFDVARTYIERIRSHMLEDQQRSEAMELILALHEEQIVDEKFHSIEESSKDSIILEDLKIWCGTWNIAGTRAQECEDLQDWLSYGIPHCDIYVFFIQELVELTTFKLLTNWIDPTKEQMLEEWFGSILKEFRMPYLKVRTISLLGLCLVVYAKSSIIHHISDIGVGTIKTGLNGNYGNKGAVAIRMKVNSRVFAFVNVHLPPGRSNTTERMEQMDFIIQNIFQDSKYRLMDMDLVFIGGDFNFRLQTPHDEILKYLCKLNIQALLEYDEFITQKRNGIPPFQFMNEQEITFQPSYKFKKNSPFYDLRRSPSWCDRILFFSSMNNKITPLGYKRHERYCSSDHKPVSAMFQIA